MPSQYADQAVKTAEREATLNDRLQKMVSTLTYQCERIEGVLSRVNGTPQKIEGGKVGSPVAVSSMQNNLDGLESQVERLVSLSAGVERIA